MLHKVEAEMSRSKSKEKTKEYVEGKDEKTAKDEERKGRKEVRVPDLLLFFFLILALHFFSTSRIWHYPLVMIAILG